MNLIAGAGHLDRILDGAEGLPLLYRADDGLRYLGYRPSTNPSRVMP